MAALLDAVFNLIKQEYAKKEPRWKRITLPQTDLAFLQKECATPSDFDPHNVRNGLVQKMLQGKSTEFSSKMHLRSTMNLHHVMWTLKLQI